MRAWNGRCIYCGVPLMFGQRVCASHAPLLRNDPMYALEALLNTTGATRLLPGASVAPTEVDSR